MPLLSRCLLALGIVLMLTGAPAVSRAQTDELSKLYPPAYVEIFKKAIHSFTARDFDAAIKHLDEADSLLPESVYGLNMRGAIAIEQKDFETGKKYLDSALQRDPKFFPARFNLIEIPFIQKRYAEARKGFQELLNENPGNELLQYRIFLTYLLEGNDAEAQKALDAIRFPSNTAAYYYAYAAWEFAHGNEQKAHDWIKSGNWVFPASRNSTFADVLYDLGWLKRPETKPATTE